MKMIAAKKIPHKNIIIRVLTVCLFMLLFLSFELWTSLKASLLTCLYLNFLFFFCKFSKHFFVSYGIFATVTTTFAVFLHIVNVNNNSNGIFLCLSVVTTNEKHTFFYSILKVSMLSLWKYIQQFYCNSGLMYTYNEAINVNGITNNWTAENWKEKYKIYVLCTVQCTCSACVVCITQ